MITQEIDRIRGQLQDVGHVLTSYDALDLPFPEHAAADLQRAFATTDQQDARTGMLMFREDAPLAVGRLMIEPVAQRLFANQLNVLDDLSMYAVNQYEAGDFFNPHQDHYDGTVMIATAIGTRNFDVYRPEEEDDTFVTVDTSYRLARGSIMLLNAYKNLGHAAQCVEGPSISVVSDVPYPMTLNQ